MKAKHKEKENKYAKSDFVNCHPIVVSPLFEMYSESIKVMGKYIALPKLFGALAYYLSQLLANKHESFEIRALENNKDKIEKDLLKQQNTKVLTSN